MFGEKDALTPPGQAHKKEYLDFIHPPEVTQHSPTFCQPLGPEDPRLMAGPLIPLTDQELGPPEGLTLLWPLLSQPVSAGAGLKHLCPAPPIMLRRKRILGTLLGRVKSTGADHAR